MSNPIQNKIPKFPREDFDLEKFIEYQEEISEKSRKNEITAKEYFNLAFQQKEQSEVFELYAQMRNLIRKYNLPIQFDYMEFNTVAHSYFINYLKNKELKEWKVADCG